MMYTKCAIHLCGGGARGNFKFVLLVHAGMVVIITNRALEGSTARKGVVVVAQTKAFKRSNVGSASFSSDATLRKRLVPNTAWHTRSFLRRPLGDIRAVNK